MHDVSVPTPGFQCETCIITAADAAAAKTRRRALGLFAIGAVLLVIAVLLWSTGRDLIIGMKAGDFPLAVWVGIGAVGCFGVGAGMLRYRPKLEV